MDKFIKIINKWESVPIWIKLLILLGVVAVEILSVYSVKILPAITNASSKFKEIDDLHVKLDENRNIAQNLSKYQEENERLLQKLDRALMYLPKEVEGENLMRSFHKLSEKNDLALDSFEIKPEVSKDFYSEIEIPVRISASFHEALTFFDQLGKMERIVNVKNPSLTSPTVKDEKVLLTVSFIAMTYRFLKSPLDAPQPSQEAGSTQKTTGQEKSDVEESKEVAEGAQTEGRKRGRER